MDTEQNKIVLNHTSSCNNTNNNKSNNNDNKEVYMKRIEEHLSGNYSRCMWQGIQTIINFRGCASTAGTNYYLAEKLNW